MDTPDIVAPLPSPLFGGALPVPFLPVDHYCKLVEFAQGGYEFYAKRYDREVLKKRFDLRPFGFGFGARQIKSRDQQDSGDVRRSQNRCKQSIRWRVRNMGANQLLTLTTRAVYSRDALYQAFKRFVRLMRTAHGGRFPYLAVVEPHKDREHLHFHVAVSEYIHFNTARRLWNIALGGNGAEKGVTTLGNIDVRKIKFGNPHRQSQKIASYISKYVTKDCAALFNQKRYSCSKAVAPKVHKFWFAEPTLSGVVERLMRERGWRPSFGPVAAYDYFAPASGDFLWLQHVPGENVDLLPEPPF